MSKHIALSPSSIDWLASGSIPDSDVPAALLSTLLGVGAEVASDDDSELLRVLRSGTQDTAGQTGRRIVDRSPYAQASQSRHCATDRSAREVRAVTRSNG